MRHIVVYDTHEKAWAVVDTRAAHMVVSFHRSARAARAEATHQEKSWPDSLGAYGG